MDNRPIIMTSTSGRQRTITSADNGKTVSTGSMSTISTITAQWNTPAIPPAGVLTFTVDGEAGEGDNTIDLGAGQRTLVCSAALAFVDITVTGLPEGVTVLLYFR